LAGVAVVGVSLAYLVGRDGSPGWQALRVVVTVGAAAVAAYAIQRGSVRVRGTAAFIAGLVAVAVGAGFGLPHLGKVGWSGLTLAGLTALVAGAVLLILGAGTIVGSTRRWWRLLVIPSLLVVCYVVLWPGIIAVAATNVPRTAVGSATPADRGLAYRDVVFPTSDGLRLSGWYVPSANAAAVVLLHGAGSTRSDVLDQAVVLARHGYGVLLFDARGHGRSGGRAMDFGWYGDRDVAAAVSFLRARPDVDRNRIAAVGMSMGGEEAIGAAATNRAIRAVVAEGATNRVAADTAFLADAYGARGRVQVAVNTLTTAWTDLLTDADPPVTLRAAAAGAAPRPVLLIAAGNVPTEAFAARHIQAGAGNVQVWVVPNAGHTQGLRTHPADWERRVVTFLDAAMAQPTG
jgi:pimeloyl-ACP methyl ester carboxylesterase